MQQFGSSIIPGNIILEDLIYIPMGNYMPMYMRPYILNVNGFKVDDLAQRLYDTKSAKVTTNILSGLTENFIQNSAVPLMSNINNDWVSTRKFVFLLKVKSIEVMDIVKYYYIFGYTNYDGITSSGNVDPNLEHTINNIIETSLFIRNIPGQGIYEKESLSKFYNVSNNEYNNVIFAQRPMDIFNNMTLNSISSLYNETTPEIQFSYHKQSTFNEFDNRPIVNNVENNIPVEYLAKIINTGLTKIPEHELFISSYSIDIDNDLSAKVAEPKLSENKFIKLISSLNGSIIVSNKFNFSTLFSIDNTIADRFKVFNITKNYVDPMLANTPEVGDYWHGQDPLTVKAYSIIESSVSMALKHGFSKLYFIASNRNNPLGQPNIFITNFNSFINLDELSFNTLLEIFKSNFENEIFYNESHENSLPLHIEMYVDMLGTSKIYIDFAGFGGNWYTIPTFANANFAPVLTFDYNNVKMLAEGLDETLNVLLKNRTDFIFNNYF